MKKFKDEMTIPEFRKNLTEIISYIHLAGKTVVLNKYNKPYVVIVPAAYEKITTEPDND